MSQPAPADHLSLSARETATLLAALRWWQSHLHRHGLALVVQDDHFATARPLTITEIDALCERLNCS